MLSWFPENISTFGGDIDGLFALIYRIVGFWFVLVEAALLYFVIRYRRGRGRPAVYSRGDRRSEMAWVLVPAVIVLALDLGIDVSGGSVWARIKEQQPAGGVEVRVTGKQFNWNFTYPGPDGKFDTADDATIENELHVPAGENVQLTLRAQDVIHSFFIPNVRLKQDVLPGRTIHGWFNATKPGRYEIACAELCGFGHYNMRGFLVVHEAADYQEWMRQQWPVTAAADGASVAPVRG